MSQAASRDHLKVVFSEIVGDKNVVDDPKELEYLGTDWTSIFEQKPLLAVLPASTEEVAKILKYCGEHGVNIVPSGGRTGLAAGAVAADGEVVLSLTRMNKIIGVDPIGLTIEAEAGVTTQALQEAARDAGFYFALDLAAKGTSQIGGNLATNAGGLKLIRFGGAREQLLGVEVVLADGSVLDMNYNLHKNNTGYDLKQLFVGSEGTLGVITKATLKMVPAPREVGLACLGVTGFADILKVLREANLGGLPITAFEFFTRNALDAVMKSFPESRLPFEETTPFYLLIEVEENNPGAEDTALGGFLEKLFEDGLVVDGALAHSSQEFNDLWGLRENITESLQNLGHVRKNDVSLPIARLGDFVGDLETLVADLDKSIEVYLFGHIGDGNIHINYVGEKTLEKAEFHERAKRVEQQVFRKLAEYRGSVSAEHGIGMLKRHDLEFSRDPLEISLMRKIKDVLDPKGILNPGKIFPPT